MKALSLQLAGLVSLFVLSACTAPQKTNEAHAKEKESVAQEAAALPAPPPAAISLRLIPCTVPNQKNCK